MTEKQKTECKRLHQKLKKLARDANNVQLSFAIYEELSKDETEIMEEFYSCFHQLQLQSIKEDYYWNYCPFSVYKSTFKERFNEFSKIAIDATLFDFVCIEIKNICDLDAHHEEYLRESFLSYRDYFQRSIKYSLETSEISPAGTNYNVGFYPKPEIEASQRRKIEYLFELAEEDHTNNENHTNSSEEILLDLSNSNNAMKIVYLKELGILEYLRDRMNEEMIFNANKLGEVVSSFTGIDSGTAQSYLNPIISNNVDQKRNPLKPKNIEKARQKLIDLGFSIKKTI